MLPMGYEGVDVHGSRGFIDWKLARRNGLDFAFVKATEGATFKDARFKANLLGCRDAGVPVGPYHYARPDNRPTNEGARVEARFFVDVIQQAGWKKTDLRPVLDLEEGHGDLSDWAASFCQEVEKLLDVRPIIYTYTYFITVHLPDNRLSAWDLWLANYGPNNGSRQVVEANGPWDEWLVHQYTSRGTFPGTPFPVDRNYTTDLRALYARVDDPRSKDDYWTWVAWRLGEREFLGCGKANPLCRPQILRKRIPLTWWLRLKVFLQRRQK